MATRPRFRIIRKQKVKQVRPMFRLFRATSVVVEEVLELEQYDGRSRGYRKVPNVQTVKEIEQDV